MWDDQGPQQLAGDRHRTEDDVPQRNDIKYNNQETEEDKTHAAFLSLFYTYCISDVIYSLVSSYGYNGRQIGQRVAQELMVHWASHGGPATRTKRRPEPHA